ncbi:uncharacterized protein C3orf38 homolog [Cimex lectularius]|uniref:NTF2 domain-containing protein n=1 Tax=Cimex lectularius TaxID=79782 RepID=A0A8I6RDS0_CIMLE|nr:uncharacterized protein C3orf38 homolog [Cimex lectularius]
MLSEQDKANLRDLLVRLPLSDLLDLAKTSSNGLLNVETKTEALEIILQHQESLWHFLTKKRITKGILFQYLSDKGVRLPTGIDKSSIMQRIIDFWAVTPQSLEPEKKMTVTNTVEIRTSLDDPAMLNTFSLEFAKWFYSKINELVIKKGGETLDKTDFWKESTASVKIIASEITTDEAQGTEGIINMIWELQNSHKLLFLPNLDQSGIKAKIDPHGLLAILTCGTLHKESGEVVGVFEQMFLLARDPNRSDTWKIKKTEMTLRSGSQINTQEELPI